MKRSGIWKITLVALVSFSAGALVSEAFGPGAKIGSDGDERMVSEHSAMLASSLDTASQATLALLFQDDPEKARRWHLMQLESAINSALESSRLVASLEMPVPNILAVLEKARPLLEADGSSTTLEALSELEKWLDEKNQEAIAADS